jgi:hypothetical protein
MDREGQQAGTRGVGPDRSPLGSPLLAGVLALIATALVGAILLLPGLLPSPAASPPPAASAASPTSTGGASPSPTPVRTFVRPTPTPGPTFTSYTVRAGDSLGSIARAFATTARSIAWWNRGTYPNLDPESAAYDPGHIEPGWVLVLMSDAVVDDLNPPTPSPAPPTPSPGPPTPEPSVGPSPSPT